MTTTKDSLKVPLLPIWSIGATLSVIFLLLRPMVGFESLEQNPAGALRDLREASEDALTWEFHSATTEFPYGPPTGEVTWSDQRQTGFIRLSGLFANDPSEEQFQLWILDPDRDSLPVSGGVFDVRYEDHKAKDEVTLPIDARLPIYQPTGFAITLEKPGGVVRSDLKKVVAIAVRPSA